MPASKSTRKTASRGKSSGGAGKGRAGDGPGPDQAIEEFSAAVKALQKKDFKGAQAAFLKLIEEHPRELEICDRARSYIVVCERETGPAEPTLQSSQEFYDHGVYLLNLGEASEAAGILARGIEKDPGNEKLLYAHACALARGGNNQTALDSLRKSIQANPSNRILAGHDQDLESLREDPGFKAMLQDPGKAGD